MAELSTGVRTLLARMESNPEEFYGEAEKWRFMFASNFREVMTEPEKGALHEALCEVRRKEFDERVMRRLLQDDMDEQILNNSFNAAYNQLRHQRHVEAQTQGQTILTTNSYK